MEKLIELLNQYEIDRGMGSVFNIWKFAGEIHYYDNEKDEFVFDNVKLYIISKQFGFIKWLVDNDKIAREGMKGHGRLISYCLYVKSWEWDKIKEGVLLMLLAIQDEPIKFLISILK